MNSKQIERSFEIIRTIVSIAIAFLLALIVIGFISDNPGEAIRKFLLGPISSFRRFANVIEMMTPLLFTGTAICIMYQANQFNLVGEGVFFISGAVAAYMAINFILPAGLHPAVIILISGISGAIIAGIPALLKVKWQANEVVSSIMLNYILLYLGRYILINHMKDPASLYNMSYPLAESSKLPVILQGTRIHWGFVIAIAFVVLAYLLIYKTKWGYEIRMTGQNASFAKYSGIAVSTVILYSQLIGGFVVGVGGASEILGMYSRFRWDALPGYGWDGILVGILARNNPALVPVSAFALAYLRIGADIVARSTDVPVEFIMVIQAIVIMLVGAELFLSSLKHKMIVKNSKSATVKESA